MKNRGTVWKRAEDSLKKIHIGKNREYTKGYVLYASKSKPNYFVAKLYNKYDKCWETVSCAYLSILKAKYYIIKEDGDERYFLGWQPPAWDEGGYFWTANRRDFYDCIKRHDTSNHPITFNSVKEAKNLANMQGIVDYRVVKRWK